MHVFSCALGDMCGRALYRLWQAWAVIQKQTTSHVALLIPPTQIIKQRLDVFTSRYSIRVLGSAGMYTCWYLRGYISHTTPSAATVSSQ
jgi:hypothetical protein